MRICKYLTAAAVTAALVAAPGESRAQESSLGTYSPYTMYGLGNLNRSPISGFMGMGGASIAFRNGGFDTTGDIRLNVSNPASLSGVLPRSFTFDVGLAGTNQYLSQRGTDGLLRTSFNTFNFNNITIALPLAPRLGVALSVAPYSEVGYKIHTDDESYLADLGLVRYYYDGQGDITEAKFATGWEPFRNFSIGAELNYLWGNIDRTYKAEIIAYTGTGTYNQVNAYTNEKVARMFAGFGMQYSPISKARTRLTLGATYRLGGKLNSDVTDYIPSNNAYDDVVRLNEYTSPTYIPQRIGAGVFFHRTRWAVGADYIWEDWANNNAYDAANDVRYVNTGTLKIGGRYTPGRYDMRGRFVSFFNRMTYKAGFRTGRNYLEFHGVPMNERAFSLGVDIPFRADKISNVAIGFEYGERGTLRQGLVKERFLRVNVGVMLFGSDYDYWFQKYKYN
jgi:hypothetical protein